MTDLARALRIAIDAHDGQVDKLGQPYILHPLRVMLAVSDRARVAAILHDVLEDSSFTVDDIADDGIEQTDIEAVVALTRLKDEAYANFIGRCLPNPIAREVKIADIRDNLSPARAAGCSASMRERYLTGLVRLLPSDAEPAPPSHDGEMV